MNILRSFVPYFSDGLNKSLLNIDSNISDSINEIRLRRDNYIVIVIRSKSYYLDCDGNIYSIANRDCMKISGAEFEDTFMRFCDYSIYSNSNSLKNGYIALKNGSRVGVCATAINNADGGISVANITSLNIRIPRQAIGCARDILNELGDKKINSTLIVGMPSSGKTTVLRDIARTLSYGYKSESHKIAIVDERNEIAAKSGNVFSLDVGSNTDVLTGFSKAIGIEIAVRSISPEYIFCDEIFTQKELSGIEFGFSSGVKFFVSLHIGDTEDLYTKPIIRQLLGYDEFENIVLLDASDYSAKIYKAKDVLNEIHRRRNDSDFFFYDRCTLYKKNVQAD